MARGARGELYDVTVVGINDAVAEDPTTLGPTPSRIDPPDTSRPGTARSAPARSAHPDAALPFHNAKPHVEITRHGSVLEHAHQKAPHAVDASLERVGKVIGRRLDENRIADPFPMLGSERRVARDDPAKAIFARQVHDQRLA
jgi:hypothetical protein